VIGRIVRSVDFERVLATPTRARSLHFAVHHLPGTPSLPQRPAIHALPTDLSTGLGLAADHPVDDAPAPATRGRSWLACVVPKRHAKRAVTRSLLKRQIRAAATRQRQLPDGLWVIRLRAPFDPKQFPSAASRGLSAAARAELDVLFAHALRGTAALPSHT
jgi:ribonuclease P protein component